jgi:chloramphenicol-sensitive protein RarD
MIWLMLTGVITAAPLVWFASAAKRVPLSIIGLLQFVAPTLQFILGVVVYNESFSAAQLGGYVIIWCALAVFAQDQRAHWRT